MSVPDVPIQHRRAVQALRSGGPATPPGLHARVARAPRRRPVPLLGPAIAAATAVVLVVAVVLVQPSTDSVTTTAARLVLRPAPDPAPAPDRAHPGQLRRTFEGVTYPDWTAEFGWRPAGARRDRVADRPTDTVYYRHTHHRIAYTVISGPPVDPPAGAERVNVDGVELHRFKDGVNDVVMFERGGRTCILSGEVHDPATLLKLAPWRGV
jgi:hypothetical protein